MNGNTKYSTLYVSGPCFKNNKNVNFIYMIINIHNNDYMTILVSCKMDFYDIGI